jgi:hypothetical protein
VSRNGEGFHLILKAARTHADFLSDDEVSEGADLLACHCRVC